MISIIMVYMKQEIENKIAERTTTSQGEYDFSDEVSKRGTYKVKVASNTGDTVNSVKVTSSTNVVGNELETNFEKNVVIEPTNRNQVVNGAILNTFSKVIIKYQLEDGSPLSGDSEISGLVGENYTTTSKNITGYTVVRSIGDTSGVYTVDTKTVIYVYKQANAGNITVKYQDEQGLQLSNDETLDGTNKLGLPYTTTSKDITNYELVETPTNASGTYTESPITVTYVYRRKNAGSVTATYKTVDGTELTGNVVQSGANKLGLPYTTEEKTFDNYELTTVPTNKDGVFTTSDITVNYVYQRKNAGNITVKYQDEQGVQLSNDETLDGTNKLGLPYTTTSKDITNYELVETPTNASGTYTESPITVTYVYRRKNAGSVTATYKTVDGTELTGNVVQSGANKLGLPYTTEEKTFDNYELTTVPTNKDGVFTTSDITVNYVYQRKNAGKVIVKYVDKYNNVISEGYELDGTNKLGIEYETKSKVISGYVLHTIPENHKGVYKTEEIVVVYVYVMEGSTEPSKPDVEIKVTCEDEGKVWDESKQMCVVERSIKTYKVPNTSTQANIITNSIYIITSLLTLIVLKRNR